VNPYPACCISRALGPSSPATNWAFLKGAPTFADESEDNKVEKVNPTLDGRTFMVSLHPYTHLQLFLTLSPNDKDNVLWLDVPRTSIPLYSPRSIPVTEMRGGDISRQIRRHVSRHSNNFFKHPFSSHKVGISVYNIRAPG
jgi:hypothetical protein